MAAVWKASLREIGERERGGETKSFLKASVSFQSVPLAVSTGQCQCPPLPKLDAAAICLELSGAPVFLACLHWESVTSHYQTPAERRGYIARGFQMEEDVSIVKKKQQTNKRKKRWWTRVCLLIDSIYNFAWTLHTFRADALICPRWRPRHPMWDEVEVVVMVCIIWDHSEIALPRLAAFSHIGKVKATGVSFYKSILLPLLVFFTVCLSCMKLSVWTLWACGQGMGVNDAQIINISIMGYQTCVVFACVYFIFPSCQFFPDLNGPVGITLTADRDTRGPAISQTQPAYYPLAHDSSCLVPAQRQGCKWTRYVINRRREGEQRGEVCKVNA